MSQPKSIAMMSPHYQDESLGKTVQGLDGGTPTHDLILNMIEVMGASKKGLIRALKLRV